MAKRAKPDPSGNRVPLMVRTAPSLRARLEAASAESGRSLAQEAEIRLERSFDLLPIVEQAVKRSGEIAAQLASEQYERLEQHMLTMVGGNDLYQIWSRLSYVIEMVENETGKKIRDDEYTKNKAERELLGAIPGVFRKLPGTYSDFKARARENAQRGGGLLSLADQFGALPTLDAMYGVDDVAD